jgi:hypothetical protein
LVKKKVTKKISIREAFEKLLLNSPASDHQAILVKLNEIVAPLGVPYTYLVALIHFETGGSMHPSTKNPNSSATGLIQFMASTARALGTSVESLSKMSVLNQLEYVKKYFAPFKSLEKTNTMAKFYLLVLRGQVVTDSNQNTMLTGYFGTYDNPKKTSTGANLRQARSLYDNNGIMTLTQIQNYFNERYIL